MAVNAQDFLAEIQKAAGGKPKQKPQRKAGLVNIRLDPKSKE